MKKFILAALSLSACLSAFAFEPGKSFLPDATGAKSYVKTDYTIASKFGEYFRTASAKYQHIFNSAGIEVENSELSLDNKVLNKIAYEYNDEGKLTSQTCFDESGNVLWKTVKTFDANGKLSEENEYDEKGILCSKSIFKYTGDNLTDDTYYSGNGALIWKNIYSYDKNGNQTETYSYYASGELESKKTFKFLDNGKISEICYFDSDAKTLLKKEVYRYDSKNYLTEIATYDSKNVLFLRVFLKYDARGNVLKISTYNIAKKFGTTVNELVAMSDFTYQY